MIRPRLPLFPGLLALGALSLTPSAGAPQTTGTNWGRIARAIVDRIAPERGERVLLVAVPGMSDALIPILRAVLKEAKARDLGVIPASGTAPASWNTDFTERAATLDGRRLQEYFERVDIAVMLPGALPTHAAYATMQRLLAAAKGGHVRTVHFHWSGAYSLDGAVVDITPERAAVYEKALLQTDYASLGAIQREFERAIRAAAVRVTTPAGTDLRFVVEDRPVTRQDGDAEAVRARQARNLIDREIELPAGAIRVAPIEESVTGTIAFPSGDWAGERVEGLVMRFERGRVVSYGARTGREAVERELLTAGDAGRSFREFALGFNPLLAIPQAGDRWIPYYGYGAGVVRLSLGDNSELGGKVSGGYVRWNFFTDATVEVGNEVWVRGGELVRVAPTP